MLHRIELDGPSMAIVLGWIGVGMAMEACLLVEDAPEEMHFVRRLEKQIEALGVRRAAFDGPPLHRAGAAIVMVNDSLTVDPDVPMISTRGKTREERDAEALRHTAEAAGVTVEEMQETLAEPLREMERQRKLAEEREEGR